MATKMAVDVFFAAAAVAALVGCVAPLDWDGAPKFERPKSPLAQFPFPESGAAAVAYEGNPYQSAGGAATASPAAAKTLGSLSGASAPAPALASRPLLIGSFNAQIFGQKKASDPAVMDVIAKIASRYDIMLLQEIRDSSSTAAQVLLNMINKPGTPYGMVVSARLGRTSSKEQYAFYYRSDRVRVNATYQFPDVDDWFQREPYTVRFSVPDAAIEDFAIMAIHAEPTDAVNETSRLVDVYEAVRRHMSLDDVLIAGDFNADCTYISGSNWGKVRLRTDARFSWLIGDCEDTTATDTDCAYDRLVAAGSRLPLAVIPGTAKPYIYSSPGLPAVNVSDHYPVEVALSGKPNVALQQQFSATLSLSVKSSWPSAAAALTALRKATATPLGGQAVGYRIWESSYGGNVTVYARRAQVSDVTSTVEQFAASFPGVVNDGTRAMLLGYFRSSDAMQRPFVHGLQPPQPLTFDVTISCALNEMICSVAVDSRVH